MAVALAWSLPSGHFAVRTPFLLIFRLNVLTEPLPPAIFGIVAIDVEAVAAVLDFLDFHRGDDRRRHRHVDVGVDEEGRRAALGAAVEDEQLAVRRRSVSVRGMDLDGRRALADDRVLAGFFAALVSPRLQLARLADR